MKNEQYNRRHNLNRLSYYLAVIEQGTITGAARMLGTSKAVVSKQLSLLEEDIGVDLILRTTRQLRPTEIGMQFYDQCRKALGQVYDAYDLAQNKGETVRGRLRIASPVDYGLKAVSPLIATFQKKYIPR
jgi:DNA-binding transcriptional LysR family regulator